MNTPTKPVRNWVTSTNAACARVLMALALTWFALSPTARAQSCLEFCDDNGNVALGNPAGGGSRNTAVGNDVLVGSSGNDNTATGYGALARNLTGNNNTAAGVTALSWNQNASGNTAVGFQALQNSDHDASGNANDNTATGAFALSNNTSAATNTATGFDALFTNTSGPVNTATGAYALYSNTTGQSNVATGVDALYHNQTGHDNTGEGYLALLNCKGSNNTALGSNAGLNLTTGSNNIDIGANVLGNTADVSVTRIGNTTQKKAFIGGIYGKTVASGLGVIVNSSGQLGTIQSSARFKDNIKPMDKASEAILALKPVTFRYKEELDPDKIPQFGLIAEDVEKVNPELVARDEDGKVNTVRYEAVNAMLLNEFLKEHRKVEKLEALLASVNARLKEQDARIAKVNAAVELTKAAPQIVSNRQ
jgi:hypothetical protein